MPYIQEKRRFEEAATRAFDPIIEMIEKHPEKCYGDAYHFKIGDDYQFWIANGFEGNLRLEGSVTFPKEFYTPYQRSRVEKAYYDWLCNNFQPINGRNELEKIFKSETKKSLFDKIKWKFFKLKNTLIFGGRDEIS